MRFPTANGLAIRSTSPANTLPRLCCAAIPMTTPAMAPPSTRWPMEIDNMESMPINPMV